jgi:competence protein ComEC
VIVVQAGYRNRYGHPAAEVMARYKALATDADAQTAITIFDTPHCGAFIWQSALPHNGVCSRTDGLRYWQHRVP